MAKPGKDKNKDTEQKETSFSPIYNSEDGDSQTQRGTPKGVQETEIMDYLNKKAGTRYRAKGKNKIFVVARLRDGFSVEDLKDIVDLKCDEWLGTDMEKYLRPATLFNATKCEQYYGQISRGRRPCVTIETKSNMQAVHDFIQKQLHP